MAKFNAFLRVALLLRAFTLTAFTFGISTSAHSQVTLVNPSFESPALPSLQILSPMPSGFGWDSRGRVALQNGPAVLWYVGVPLTHGRQWAFLPAGTAISQTVTLQPGAYVVSLQAAQASNGTAAQVKVTLGTTSATALTPGTNFGVLTFGGINIATAGSYKLTIEVPEPAPGTGYSYGARVDDVIVAQSGTNAPPSVVMTSPISGQTIIANNTTLRADARDADGTISKVEFYEGASLLGTAFAAPWTIAINTNFMTSAPRVITAKAYDNQGATTTSDPVAFSHNTGGAFPFVHNGNFEAPGLAVASYSGYADSWSINYGGIATVGAVPPDGSAIAAPPEGLQTLFMTTTGGQGQVSQTFNLPAGSYGLSFRLGLAYGNSITTLFDGASTTATASGRQYIPITKATSGNSSLIFVANNPNGGYPYYTPGMEVIDDAKIGAAGPAIVNWVIPSDN